MALIVVIDEVKYMVSSLFLILPPFVPPLISCRLMLDSAPTTLLRLCF